jgi:hypothetical protein
VNGGVPSTATLRVTLFSSATLMLIGCAVSVGGRGRAFTRSTAALLVTLPALLDTTTRNWALSSPRPVTSA